MMETAINRHWKKILKFKIAKNSFQNTDFLTLYWETILF